ncbi:MAG: tRNA-dihydrouridine synthase family protein [Spirochaetaceae bacterium]|jgi:tRNA-dihydrouridine synthase|nr:tRNA-dihydrouridine synthase family protein [Spirochaetaceae bacterium]
MAKALLLAPMSELSHRALRQLIEDFGGADEYFGEMTSAGAVVGGGPFEKYYLDSGPAPERFVYQICGSKQEALCKAAEFLNKRDCLGVDVNMGCAAPAIYKRGAGAAWLKSVDKAGVLAAALRKRVTKRLSVKLRVGETDDFEYLLEFCKRLQDEGVDFITLHGRTISEKFKGACRWDYAEALKKELKIPVAGNGGITNAAEFAFRVENSMCDAVMIGRLAVKEPWIFSVCRNGLQTEGSFLTPLKLQDSALCFLEYLNLYQPPEFHYSRARRFFYYFFANIKWAEYMRNRVNREKTLAQMEKLIIEYFSNEALC